MKRIRSWVKLTASVLLGILFLWLAFRNVKFSELLNKLDTIHYGWIFPFTITVLISHYFRAERWRLLIREREGNPHRLTLFSGVMLNYLLNLVFPRLGEVTRPVYVARQEGLSSSKLIGTIVLERIIDMATQILLMGFVFFYIIADVQLLRNIFGKTAVSFFRNFFELQQLAYVIGGLIATGVLLYAVYRGLVWLSHHFELMATLLNKIRNIVYTFIDGLLAIRDVDRWGRFLVYTVIIWTGYVMMTYIPFHMFDMQQTYDLGLVAALSVTVISAIGIIIPTPGGIGTYHYFVKQSLLILFAVPAARGLAYATVTHAVMMLIIIVFTPLVILTERLVLNRTSGRGFSLQDIKAAED